MSSVARVARVAVLPMLPVFWGVARPAAHDGLALCCAPPWSVELLRSASRVGRCGRTAEPLWLASRWECFAVMNPSWCARARLP